MDNKINPNRILVTGGCGFIGSHFIRHLLHEVSPRPDIVVNVDSLTYAGNRANTADIEDDPLYHMERRSICNEGEILVLLQRYEIEAVVHFAAESHVDRSIDSPEPFFNTNVIGTLRLLNAFRRYWTNLDRPRSHRFLHISTDEIYGSLDATDAPFREDSPYASNSPYAASKASSNLIVRAFSKTYNLPTIITNSSNNYGPFQFPEKLIPHMILNALRGRPLPIYGDGLQVRDWLYVSDHVEALWQVLSRGRAGETYNIGGSSPASNNEIVYAICQLLDRKSPRIDRVDYAKQIIHVTDRPGHDRCYRIDSGKTQRELGWTPRQSLSSGLDKTVDWYLSHQDWATTVTDDTYRFERLGVDG